MIEGSFIVGLKKIRKPLLERGTFFLLLRLFFVKFMWNFCVPNGTHPLFQKVALPSSRLHFKTGGSFFYNRTTYSCQWLSSLSLQNLILDPKVKGDTNILWQWTLIAWQRGTRCNNTATGCLINLFIIFLIRIVGNIFFFTNKHERVLISLIKKRDYKSG